MDIEICPCCGKPKKPKTKIAHPASTPGSVMQTGLSPNGMVHKAQTELAQTWAGHRYGLQALKPSLEFLAVAQVPYSGRPVDCITRTGAGAWNIEAGRIPGPAWKWGTQTDIRGGGYGSKRPADGDIYAEDIESDPGGRWPANLLLDEAGGELLDRQSLEQGIHGAGHSDYDRTRQPYKASAYHITNGKQFRYGDSGGASRMFFQSTWQYEILEQLENADPLKYEPKVSTAEREAGLDGFEAKHKYSHDGRGNSHEIFTAESANDSEWAKKNPAHPMKNNHPTLKPISLTKYLATLLLPPDAYAPRRICIPFGGAGSEAIGSVLAGWEEVVVIEKYPLPDKPISQENPDYIGIARARLAWWSQWPGWGQTDVDKILASLREDVPAEQLSLFEEAA